MRLIFEFHGGLEWRGRPPAHLKCRQKIGRKCGVKACHIVRPGGSKNDQEMRNCSSENRAIYSETRVLELEEKLAKHPII